jgi:hypothetical protein
MKVDPVALTSCGVYSEVYGVGEEGNLANLFASLGYLEDAPTGVTAGERLRNWFWEFIE